jgi:hypothetical protein
MDDQEDIFLTLGEVTRRLKNALGLPSNSAARRLKLHQLLRTGTLKGFITIPGNPALRVVVPEQFWQTVDTARLITVRFVTNSDKLIGTFKLRPLEIADAMAMALLSEENRGQRETLVANAVKLADQDREVYIRQADLDEWILDQGRTLEEQFEADKPSNRGRRPRSGWAEVWRAFAEILLQLIMENKIQLPKDDSLFTAIRQAAREAGASDIPEHATIRKEMAKFIASKRL